MSVRSSTLRVVRRLPGATSALAAAKRSGDELRRQVRPPRPPFGPPERVAQLAGVLGDDAFITGNGFAARCRHVLNFDVLGVNDDVENDWWFCKTDYLEYFFRELEPREPYVLFSHNSARSVGRRFGLRLRTAKLVAWFAQNPTLRHHKLHALPVGIPNPKWASGDTTAIRRVQADPPVKERLVDVSFEVATNPRERGYCIEQTGLEPEPRLHFEPYLRRLASAWFCLAPRGRGIDTVRTWEALYVGTVPIVTRSVLTEQHPDLPWIVLDDWSQFRSLELSPELHERVWGSWSRDELRLDRYLARVERIIAELRP